MTRVPGRAGLVGPRLRVCLCLRTVALAAGHSRSRQGLPALFQEPVSQNQDMNARERTVYAQTVFDSRTDVWQEHIVA